MQINLSDEAVATLVEKALTDRPAKDQSGFVGKNVFIRTVTFHYTGHLVSEGPTWLVLADAAWIGDSGRFSDALRTGNLSEVEPYPNSEIRVAVGSVVDMCEWTADLPRDQK